MGPIMGFPYDGPGGEFIKGNKEKNIYIGIYIWILDLGK